MRTLALDFATALGATGTCAHMCTGGHRQAPEPGVRAPRLRGAPRQAEPAVAAHGHLGVLAAHAPSSASWEGSSSVAAAPPFLSELMVRRMRMSASWQSCAVAGNVENYHEGVHKVACACMHVCVCACTYACVHECVRTSTQACAGMYSWAATAMQVTPCHSANQHPDECPHKSVLGIYS